MRYVVCVVGKMLAFLQVAVLWRNRLNNVFLLGHKQTALRGRRTACIIVYTIHSELSVGRVVSRKNCKLSWAESGQLDSDCYGLILISVQTIT
jgi:hypothetical protein